MKRPEPIPVAMRAITWDHPRGSAPLVAAAEAWRVSTGAVVQWELRSLQEFAETPVADLSSRYDLVVLDHPHIGDAVAVGALACLEDLVGEPTVRRFGAESIGRSHDSYRFAERQWAFAIDAACHVAAWRDGLDPPSTWDEVLELARDHRVLWPLKEADALCSFLTLLANVGRPWPQRPNEPRDSDAIEYVLERMQALADLVPRACLEMNPIDVLERICRSRECLYSPILFGYCNYARSGFRGSGARFGSIARLGDDHRGAILGGAGIGVSATAADPVAAAAFAAWVAGAECQRGLFFESGGQPAHIAAWEDRENDREAAGFFSDTREAMEFAWVRPRHAGFVDLQGRLGATIWRFLRDRAGVAETAAAIADL